MNKNAAYRSTAALFKRTALLIGCLMFLYGCSNKTAYHFLDWGIKWHIGKYVNYTHKQKEFVEKSLDDFHAWHRQTQLLPYAHYIEGLKERLNSGEVTGEMLHAEVDQIQVMVDRSVDQLLPMLVELAVSLSDEQVSELMKKLREKREEYEKKHVSPSMEEVIEQRVENLKDHLSPYIGRLTKKQAQWLRDWAESLVSYEEATLVRQQVWAEEVEAMLARRHGDRSELQRELRRLIVTNTDDWPEDVQALFDKNQELTYDFLARLVNNLTPKQRERMNRKLDSYVHDLYDLARNNSAGG